METLSNVATPLARVRVQDRPSLAQLLPLSLALTALPALSSRLMLTVSLLSLIPMPAAVCRPMDGEGTSGAATAPSLGVPRKASLNSLTLRDLEPGAVLPTEPLETTLVNALRLLFCPPKGPEQT